MCCFSCLIFISLFVIVLSENATLQYGLLTPECVKSYLRLYVTRRVPPRNYRYYHETLMPGYNQEQNFNLSSGLDQFQWRIVGGVQVPISDIPYQVMYGIYCGGTLISPEWVITAAHCKDTETFILAGSTYRSQALKYPICAHFMHPLWSSTGKAHKHDYDFQLVLLEIAVPVTPSSRPIAIGNLEDIKVGGMVTVSGWGHLEYKQGKMQELVRKVSVPIISSEVCKLFPNPNYTNVTARMFCAGFSEGGKDSCQGDSGGPAVINGKLVGLVSFGAGCAMKNQPGVYSSIPTVRGWIRRITNLPL